MTGPGLGAKSQLNAFAYSLSLFFFSCLRICTGTLRFYVYNMQSSTDDFRWPARRLSRGTHSAGPRVVTAGTRARWVWDIVNGFCQVRVFLGRCAVRSRGRPNRMEIGSASESAIPRQSLTSAVAERLRNQIIRGEIPEGAQLRQDAIAIQFKVSRIPVREALRQLHAEGLIAIVPNRGAVVPALSPDDIEELFTIRALLEPELLKLSIPRLTEEDFAEADRILRKFVGELRREDHLSNWGRLNWQFHSILYSQANRSLFHVRPAEHQ